MPLLDVVESKLVYCVGLLKDIKEWAIKKRIPLFRVVHIQTEDQLNKYSPKTLHVVSDWPSVSVFLLSRAVKNLQPKIVYIKHEKPNLLQKNKQTRYTRS